MAGRWNAGRALVLASLVLAPAFCGHAAAPQDRPNDDPTGPKGDLSTRYRFQERYTTGAANAKIVPGAILAYKAAYREVIKQVTDAPKGGAPERNEYTRQAIWTERPGQISSADPSKVIASLRRYEKVRVATGSRTGPEEPPLLEGMDIWIRPQAGGFPLVLSQTEGRGLRAEEYRFLCLQVVTTDLAGLLPTGTIHVGDKWRVNRVPNNLISGGATGPGSLAGHLTEIQAGKDGGPDLAIFNYKGEVPTPNGAAEVVARVEFAFEAKLPPADTKGLTAKSAPPVEANGAIVRFSLAQEDNRLPLPDDPRRKTDLRRELVFERQILREGGGLTLPRDLPAPTPENSWLGYVDPKGQFQVRFPQDMTPTDIDSKGFTLRRRTVGGEDLVRFQLVAEAQPKIDDLVKDLKERWAEQKIDAISGGPPQALPESEWPDRKVYRTEAVLRAPANATKTRGSGRKHFFGYAVQSGGRNGLTVESMTSLDPPTIFRDQVEGIIKSFKFSLPSDEKPKDSPGE